MAKFKVVIPGSAFTTPTDTLNARELAMEALSPLEAEVLTIPSRDEQEFLDGARDADAIIGGKFAITKTLMENLERCRVIALRSVGADTVDLTAATALGIPVTNVPDVFIDEVADHTLALILAVFRRLTIMDAMARDGRWKEGRPHLNGFPRLMGQTLGLVSFGNVPRAVATRAAPFGLRILAFDPYVGELAMTRRGIEPVGLTELLQRSDIVSMHAPATSETRHMLSEEQFRLMKPHSVLINTGRGDTIDEDALVRALTEGWIGGAGLDVLESEPAEPDNPLLQIEKVIITPHVASASSRADPERNRRVGREIALVLTGRWPRACLNPSVLESSDLRRWKPDPMD